MKVFYLIIFYVTASVTQFGHMQGLKLRMSKSCFMTNLRLKNYQTEQHQSHKLDAGLTFRETRPSRTPGFYKAATSEMYQIKLGSW